MKQDRKHIDDFFREKFTNHKETLPPEAWDEMEARLAAPAGPVATPFRWFWHAAIIGALLILGFTVAKNLGDRKTESALADREVTGTIVPTATDNRTTEAQNVPGTSMPATTASGESTHNTQPGIQGTEGGKIMPNTAQNTSNSAGSVSGSIGAPRQQASNARNTRNARRRVQPGRGFNHTGEESYTANKPTSEPEYISTPAHSENSAATDLASASPEQTQPGNAPTTSLPGVLKPADSTTSGVSAAKKNTEQLKGRKMSRFEMGIKAGYEGGWDNLSATKLVLSSYLQYNLDQRWAIMTQPAIKSASVRSQTGSPASYYQVNNDGQTVQSGATVAHKAVLGPGDTITDYYATPFTYSQSHDSIVKTTHYGGSYFELELPILLQYKLTERLKVYGGVNLVYHQFNAYSVNTYTRKGIVRSVSETDTTSPSQPITAPTDLSFSYNGNPIQNYRNPVMSQSAQLLAGYMVGFSYNYSRRWLVDALVQQTPVNTSGGTLAEPFTGASYRLSIGYKITR